MPTGALRGHPGLGRSPKCPVTAPLRRVAKRKPICHGGARSRQDSLDPLEAARGQRKPSGAIAGLPDGSNFAWRSWKRQLPKASWEPFGAPRTVLASPRKAPREPQEGSKRGSAEPPVQHHGAEFEAISSSALLGASWGPQDSPSGPQAPENPKRVPRRCK